MDSCLQLHPLHVLDSPACILHRWSANGTCPVRSCMSAATWFRCRILVNLRYLSDGVVPSIYLICVSRVDCFMSFSACSLMRCIHWYLIAMPQIGKCLLGQLLSLTSRLCIPRTFITFRTAWYSLVNSISSVFKVLLVCIPHFYVFGYWSDPYCYFIQVDMAYFPHIWVWGYKYVILVHDWCTSTYHWHHQPFV